MDNRVKGRSIKGPGSAIIEIFFMAAICAGFCLFYGSATYRADRAADVYDSIIAVVANSAPSDFLLADNAAAGQQKIGDVGDYFFEFVD